MADSTNGGGPIETRGPVVFAVTTAMMVITTIFVGLRLFSRFYVVRRISWDDYFIILAWVSGIELTKGEEASFLVEPCP